MRLKNKVKNGEIGIIQANNLIQLSSGQISPSYKSQTESFIYCDNIEQRLIFIIRQATASGSLIRYHGFFDVSTLGTNNKPILSFIKLFDNDSKEAGEVYVKLQSQLIEHYILDLSKFMI